MDGEAKRPWTGSQRSLEEHRRYLARTKATEPKATTKT